jgi:hypothetical protein
MGSSVAKSKENTNMTSESCREGLAEIEKSGFLVDDYNNKNTKELNVIYNTTHNRLMKLSSFIISGRVLTSKDKDLRTKKYRTNILNSRDE